MQKWVFLLAALAGIFQSNSLQAAPAAQSPGNAGTVKGVITDPSGAAIPGAEVAISNKITGYHRSLTTSANGSFAFQNVPRNTYHMEVTATGFAAKQQDIAVRSAVPVTVVST